MKLMNPAVVAVHLLIAIPLAARGADSPPSAEGRPQTVGGQAAFVEKVHVEREYEFCLGGPLTSSARPAVAERCAANAATPLYFNGRLNASKTNGLLSQVQLVFYSGNGLIRSRFTSSEPYPPFAPGYFAYSLQGAYADVDLRPGADATTIVVETTDAAAVTTSFEVNPADLTGDTCIAYLAPSPEGEYRGLSRQTLCVEQTFWIGGDPTSLLRFVSFDIAIRDMDSGLYSGHNSARSFAPVSADPGLFEARDNLVKVELADAGASINLRYRDLRTGAVLVQVDLPKGKIRNLRFVRLPPPSESGPLSG